VRDRLTLTALKMPAVDAKPSSAGVQTNFLAFRLSLTVSTF